VTIRVWKTRRLLYRTLMLERPTAWLSPTLLAGKRGRTDVRLEGAVLNVPEESRNARKHVHRPVLARKERLSAYSGLSEIFHGHASDPTTYARKPSALDNLR
jgi:hypothetical protein